MKSMLIFLLLSMFQGTGFASPYPTEIQGENILNKKELKIAVGNPQKKALVVVFLSAKCPCSDSHISELKALAQQYPSFEFVGVHSNIDEAADVTQTYFESVKLPFAVIQDVNNKIADEFKAFKTPHVFVVSPAGETLYQGGVSDSKKFDKADHKFLREALEDLDSGKPVRNSNGRTLGCAITRGEKDVW